MLLLLAPLKYEYSSDDHGLTDTECFIHNSRPVMPVPKPQAACTQVCSRPRPFVQHYFVGRASTRYGAHRTVNLLVYEAG